MKILNKIMSVISEPFVALMLVTHYFFPVDKDNWMLLLAFILASDVLERLCKWIEGRRAGA